MNSRALIEAALAGRPTPRVPVGPLAVHFCARIAGVTLRQYSREARVLAEAVLRYHERFQPDAVWVSADTWVSAEAMGARVESVDEHQPLGGMGDPLVRNAADLDRIPPPDVGSHGRYPLMLEALSRIVGQLGDEVCVVACFDQYPFSLAAALVGLEPLLLKAVDDRAFVEAVMLRASEYARAYGMALAAGGAHVLSGGDSPAGLLGPALYEALAQPAEQRLVTELQQQTHRPVALHICGDATRLLPGMVATGADILELDHAVDLARACRIVGSRVALWGNLDPVGVLARGSSSEVEQKAREAIQAVRASGHPRYVLSSGCTLAWETPPENLDALRRAAQ